MAEIKVDFPYKKRNNLLRGAVWKLEEMLVVGEVMVQRSILLRGHVLEKIAMTIFLTLAQMIGK